MIIINSSCLVNQTKLLFAQFALNHYCADELHCLFVHTADVMNSSPSAVWFAVGRGTPTPILCRCLRILRWCLTFLNPRLSLIFRVISIICFLLLIFRPRLTVFLLYDALHCYSSHVNSLSHAAVQSRSPVKKNLLHRDAAVAMTAHRIVFIHSHSNSPLHNSALPTTTGTAITINIYYCNTMEAKQNRR